MKLTKINEWLSLIANLGVIAGIFFLAMEIQQNTNAQLATSRQQLLASDLGMLDTLIAYPEMLTSETELDDAQRSELRSGMYRTQVMRSREFAYWQYKDGLMDEAAWESYLGVLLQNLSSGSNREILDTFPGDPDFLALLRERMSESNR